MAERPELLVWKVQHASPGTIDLLGLGKVLEQVKEFLFGSIDRLLNAENRQQELLKGYLDLETAKQDQIYLENERERASQRVQELHIEELRTKRLQNIKRIQEVSSAELKSQNMQMKLAKKIEKMMVQNELDNTQQSALIAWLDSRHKMVSGMVSQGKITSLGDIVDHDT